MEILVHNYVPNQTVFTPFIILKGSLVNVDDKDDLGTFAECIGLNADCFQAHLCNCAKDGPADQYPFPPATSDKTDSSFRIGHRCGECQCHTKIPIKLVQTSFVMVVKLSIGQNTIVFTYSNQLIGQFSLILINPLEDGNQFYVHSLIVHCSDSNYDGEFIERAQKRIRLGLQLAQTAFSGLDSQRQSFTYKNLRKSNSTTVVEDSYSNIVRLDLTRKELLENYTTDTLWEYLARQVKNTVDLWNKKCKYVAFVLDQWKSTRINEVNSDSIVESAYDFSKVEGLGGGGLAVLESQFLVVWPEEWTDVLQQMWNDRDFRVSNDLAVDGNSRGVSKNVLQETIGKYYSKSLGGLIHEMGHIFDLGHAEDGIMGNEYHHANLLFAPFYHKLSSRPEFSESTIAARIEGKVILPNTGQISDNKFIFTKSSSSILHHHRWFRKTYADDKSTIQFDRNTINSTSNLKTIELRDISTGLVIKSWLFDENSNTKNTFVIGKRSIPFPYCTSQVQLVVQNECGVILKECLNCTKLPEVFTTVKRMLV